MVYQIASEVLMLSRINPKEIAPKAEDKTAACIALRQIASENQGVRLSVKSLLIRERTGAK